MEQVTYYRKDTAHGFHIFMSIITAGMWLVVYLPLLAIRATHKKRQVTTWEYPR